MKKNPDSDRAAAVSLLMDAVASIQLARMHLAHGVTNSAHPDLIDPTLAAGIQRALAELAPAERIVHTVECYLDARTAV